MHVPRVFVPVVLALAINACAAGTGGTTSGSGPRNQLTQEQMLASNTSNVYDAVRRLRPDWMRGRGASSRAGVLVYLDGVRRGDVNELQQFSITQVVAVRFVSATDATTRWGTGHAAGVIEVLTR